MKAAEYRKMTDEELEKELEGLRKQLFDLRTKKITDAVENSAMLRSLRRDIARLLTVRNERRKAAGKKPGAAGAAETKSAERAGTQAKP